MASATGLVSYLTSNCVLSRLAILYIQSDSMLRRSDPVNITNA
ncbi:hypothetical protein M3J09_007047 [Ascochyta lentis]